jgi:hypothetical protein
MYIQATKVILYIYCMYTDNMQIAKWHNAQFIINNGYELKIKS